MTRTTTPLARAVRGGRALGWSGLAVAGLALGLAGLTGPWQRLAAGGPPALLTLRLPDAVRVAVLVLFGLAFLLLCALLLSRPRRRTRNDEEEFQLYYEPPKVSPWVLVAFLALALVPLGILVSIYMMDSTPFAPGAVLRTPPAGAPATPPGSPPGPLRPTISLPVVTGAAGTVAVLAGLASLAVMLWIVFADRLAWWWAGALGGGPAPASVVEAVEESLDELRREPDVRRAIILCYRRFEQALAASGFPRAPWETPTEFMRKALGRLALPPEAVRALTRLFQISRFSTHPLGPADRDHAIGALIAIKAALEEAAARAAA
jgi:hypothetical protein